MFFSDWFWAWFHFTIGKYYCCCWTIRSIYLCSQTFRRTQGIHQNFCIFVTFEHFFTRFWISRHFFKYFNQLNKSRLCYNSEKKCTGNSKSSEKLLRCDEVTEILLIIEKLFWKFHEYLDKIFKRWKKVKLWMQIL